MLCILTCAVAAAAARNTRGARSTKGGQNVRRQRRPSLVAIEHAYNLSKASAGREAIDEAVLFVANEERAGATLGARAADEVARLLRAKQTAPGADEVAPLLRPGREVCAVTKKTLREDGVYLYRGDDAVVPYAHDCWILRARYHTAPGCEPKTAGVGRAAGAPPVWAWHWTVRDAAEGKCSLPDTRDPALAAASYLRLTNRRPRSGRKLTLVLLGLSYMGQPFISLGCKAARYLDGGASKVRTRIKTAQEEPQWRPIHTVRSEPNATRPAVCTGFVRHDVPKWYLSPTHNNQPPPVQRPLTCTADGGIYEFPGDPGLRVCYKYQFGKISDQGLKAPCGIALKNVDILLTYRSKSEALKSSALLRAEQTQGLHVESVDGVYQDALVSQLKNAFRRKNLAPPTRDYPRATPQKCAAHDVHFAQPGVPDYAVDAWLAWLASGLRDG